MILDIGIMGNWSTQLLAIGGLCGGIYWICREIFNVKDKLAEHDNCIQDSKEERRLLIEVNRTILEVVAHGKNNGNVEEAEKKIHEFLSEKAHE